MNISVKEASNITGMSEQFIRIGLQRGLIPIGTAVKMSSRWTYYISPKKLEEFTGISLERSENKWKRNLTHKS